MSDEPVTITDPEHLLQQYAYAIAGYDCGMFGAEVPAADHPHWAVWRGQAEAVLKVRDHYLEQLRQRLELAVKGLQGPPAPDYAGVWSELTGYVREAVDDGGIINPVEFADYLRELKHRANAPTRAWFDALIQQRDAKEDM